MAWKFWILNFLKYYPYLNDFPAPRISPFLQTQYKKWGNYSNFFNFRDWGNTVYSIDELVFDIDFCSFFFISVFTTIKAKHFLFCFNFCQQWLNSEWVFVNNKIPFLKLLIRENVPWTIHRFILTCMPNRPSRSLYLSTFGLSGP